jgi:hypothetical protein
MIRERSQTHTIKLHLQGIHYFDVNIYNVHKKYINPERQCRLVLAKDREKGNEETVLTEAGLCFKTTEMLQLDQVGVAKPSKFTKCH